jgi:hypothetical protein
LVISWALLFCNNKQRGGCEERSDALFCREEAALSQHA